MSMCAFEGTSRSERVKSLLHDCMKIDLSALFSSRDALNLICYDCFGSIAWAKL